MVAARRAEGRRIRTGVALSATELCAADLRLRQSATHGWRAPLDAPSADGSSWPGLSAAFSDLARALGVTQGTLAISLMPPLTEVRRLELPPLRPAEVERLLARDAGKYFVGARTPQLVGAATPARRARGGPVPIVAAAASARLIATIRDAAAQAGWTIDSISPAEAAWAAAAMTLWPSFARDSAFLIVAHDDRTDLLQLDGGRLAGVRRFRACAADADHIAEAVGGRAGRAGIVGRDQPRRELTRVLAQRGVTLATPPSDWTDASEHPDLMAAHFAGPSSGPLLQTEDVVVVERASARRTAWFVAGVAAALIVAAAGLELWGVHRELRAVRDERERLRPSIAATLVGRTTVEAAYEHLSALSAVDRTAPHWSVVIATLADALPDDAFLTGFRVRGDSLVVEGLADHAARVFDALERAPGLANVQAAAPVRRELQEGGDAKERFTISARVRNLESSSALPASRAPASSSGASRPAGE